MGGRRRYIGGICFRCIRPGLWISEGKGYSIVHTLAGTIHAQWELYQTCKNDPVSFRVKGQPFNNMYDLIDFALTMGELCYDWELKDDFPLVERKGID